MGNAVDLFGDEVEQIDVFVAVDVGAEGEVLAVGGEFAAADSPFILGKPGNLFAGDIQQADVVVAVCRVGGDAALRLPSGERYRWPE